MSQYRKTATNLWHGTSSRLQEDYGAEARAVDASPSTAARAARTSKAERDAKDDDELGSASSSSGNQARTDAAGRTIGRCGCAEAVHCDERIPETPKFSPVVQCRLRSAGVSLLEVAPGGVSNSTPTLRFPPRDCAAMCYPGREGAPIAPAGALHVERSVAVCVPRRDAGVERLAACSQ